MKRLQDQLSTYDRNTAEEQEIIMRTAEREMESLKGEIAKNVVIYQSTSAEYEACRERETELTAQCEDMKKRLLGNLTPTLTLT
jgi:uncharacterized protein involved in exopolysaccharide biosynthesis